MAVHTKYTLGGPSISKIFNLSLAISTLEAVCAEGLIASKNGEIFYFVHATTAAIGAVVADKRAIAE